jgi:excisionase family DNA binding protein
MEIKRMPQILLTPQQVSQALGIQKETVRHYARTGKLNPIRINKRKFLYSQSDVERLLREAIKRGI